ncbi:RecQ family ATP-dependent DNA helicase [Apilactobacillus apisilvae]|uniref:ATP-dependent DNA helicase RecQ n=1 Tax=Apilactobacillus apisilvae TaxID=2923364 RepID=A0ABY4PHW0_9LACO|nr:RecQ family ATP-dependent DNA helicase [Apilactobacillus apisilvae]UQS85421.1 RecQ family ATP-dependent DNA helicase [Apilactobacillus apisilvae]
MNSDLSLQEKLYYWFGFTDFRPGQLEILKYLNLGRNVFGVLPTGTGKTLIYQFFGKLINKPIVIVSPLISLMQDQVDRMRYLGEKKTIALTSNLNFNEKKKVLNNLNKYNYIYISPEMLSQEDVIKSFKNIDLGLFVIDEVHCIIQWGPDFRPDYLNLKNVINYLNFPQILMLTATASSKDRSSIINILNLSNVKFVTKSVNRSNIMLSVKYCDDKEDKNNKLLSLVNKFKSPGIIYFSSKKIANKITNLLKVKTNLNVEAYHSDLDSENRYRIQHQFMNNHLDLICATSAFGMGIDKNDIRYVIHYHMPSNIESYIQEIGRAGRDGLSSIAIILYQDNDETLQYNLLINNIPDDSMVSFYYDNYQSLKNTVEDKLDLLKYYYDHHYSLDETKNVFKLRSFEQNNNLNAMIDYVDNHSCRRNKLLSYFNESFDNHDDKCCDGNETILDDSELLNQHDYKKDNYIKNWHQIIDSLFNKPLN